MQSITMVFWNLNKGEIHNALFDLTGAPSECYYIWERDLSGKLRTFKNRAPPEGQRVVELKGADGDEEGFIDKLMFWKKKKKKIQTKDRHPKKLVNGKLKHKY